MKTCSKCGYTTENDQAKFCKNVELNLLLQIVYIQIQIKNQRRILLTL